MKKQEGSCFHTEMCEQKTCVATRSVTKSESLKISSMRTLQELLLSDTTTKECAVAIAKYETEGSHVS